MTSGVMTPAEIDRAMILVRTTGMTLREIGAMWLVSGEAIAYHMKRRGVERGDLLTRRFWNRVDQTTTPDGCWPWMGARVPDGYGHVRRQNAIWVTHRLAYALTFGSIPDGMLVCHTCDNPPCCNPAHLWLGTNADNSHDRDRKGRQVSPSGDAHWTKRRALQLNLDITAAKGELARFGT